MLDFFYIFYENKKLARGIAGHLTSDSYILTSNHKQAFK
jgi:hypothetical protein